MIESSKRWWKCRNRFGQVGFVPFNILEPMVHIDSPVNGRLPSVRHKHTHISQHRGLLSHEHTSESFTLFRSTFLQAPVPPPLAKTFCVVPPSPPTPPVSHSPQYPRSLPPYSQHMSHTNIPAVDDAENRGTANLCVFVQEVWMCHRQYMLS